MKKKITVALLTLALLTACETQPPVSSAVKTPDIEAIIQRSVDEAIREKIKEHEEEKKEKDREIAELKAQLELLATQPENRSEEPMTEPPADTTSMDAAPSPPTETPFQPKPEPTLSQSSTLPPAYDSFDLKNMYPDFVWESPMEEAKEVSYTAGCLLEEAQEAICLANREREGYGLDPLPIDDALMELAEIRVEEIKELYSHTRPDGTTVVEYRCGENLGQQHSAAEQVESWMDSEGHRANILLERYHHIGAACYQAENGNHYWAMVFSLE